MEDCSKDRLEASQQPLARAGQVILPELNHNFRAALLMGRSAKDRPAVHLLVGPLHHLNLSFASFPAPHPFETAGCDSGVNASKTAQTERGINRQFIQKGLCLLTSKSE